MRGCWLSRQTRVRGPRKHEGTILTNARTRCETNAAAAWTTKEGHVTIVVAIDHCTAEGVGIHAANVGNRLEAL
jgi:hypothetical protein